MRHAGWDDARRRARSGARVARVSLVAIAALLLVSIGPGTAPSPAPVAAAGPATYIVTVTGEPANGADAACTQSSCTLRQAVNAANANDPGPGNANTILIGVTQQTLTLSRAAGFGTLTLSRPVAITGPGATLFTVDGGCTDCGTGNPNTNGTGVGVFAVNAGVAVSFSGLTIAHGNNNGGDGGGAIVNRGGVVTATNCVFTNNAASGTALGGGAIYNVGTLTVTDSTFTGNITRFLGGAILNFGAGSAFAVTRSTFTDNEAPAGDGGAVYNGNDSTATITISAFVGNTASGAGSAISNFSTLVASPARLTLVNSTLSGNFATGTTNTALGIAGSGALVSMGAYATTTIVGSTITGNSAITTNGTGGVLALRGGAVTLTDTISAGNSITGAGAGGSPDLFSDTPATPFTGTYNLIGVGSGTNFTGLTNNINGNRVGAGTPLDPLLAPLGSNGGSVQTHALLRGSPAIDAGICTYTDATGVARVLAIDARGMSRPQGAACDIGNYELLASSQTFVVTRAADDVNDANCTAAQCTLRQAINASNLTAGVGTNTITFAFDAPGSQPITLSNAAGFGFLAPTHNVVIDATAPLHAVVIRAGSGLSSLFVVDNGSTLGLRGLTLSGPPGGFGGGIYVPMGSTLNVASSTFSSTIVATGGAIANSGTLNVVGSTFSGNRTTLGSGGAIANSGAATVVNSTFSNNAASVGGAIANSSGGTLNVVGSTFSGNNAFTNLFASPNRGMAAVAGGAVSDNAMPAFSSGGVGGAISNSGTLSLTLSVVAGNGAPVRSPDIDGAVNMDGGGNVIGDTAGSSGLTATNDRLHVPALLAPLALNAPGAVQTFALLPGSPALDIAACPTDPLTGAALATDARGVPRPQGAACDAGAFESPAPVASAPLAADDGPYAVPGGNPLAVPAATGVLANDMRGAPVATISTYTQPAHGSVVMGSDGAFAYTPTAGYSGPDRFTYTLTNSVASSTATVSLTVTAATVTALTVTAPAANGGATPTLRPGGTLTLIATGTYANGTTGPATGLTYTSSNPTVATVDPATGFVIALTGGQTTITVTGPNPPQGAPARAAITVTVPTAAGGGLVPPGVQPAIHPGVPLPTLPNSAGATVAPQPGAHPTGTGGNGTWPQVAPALPAAPNPQPTRH